MFQARVGRVAGRYVPSAHTFPRRIVHKLQLGTQDRHTVGLGTLDAYALAGIRVFVPNATVPRQAPGIALIAEQGVHPRRLPTAAPEGVGNRAADQVLDDGA